MPQPNAPNGCTFCASGPVTLDDAGAISIPYPVETVCDDIVGPSCPPTCGALDASCPIDDAATGICTPLRLDGISMPFGLCL